MAGKIEDYSTDGIDTFNKFLVGMRAQEPNILIQRPVLGPITKADALNLAAYLVSLADPDGERFAKVLKAVQNT